MSTPDIYKLDYYTKFKDQYQKLSHLPGFVLLESSPQSNGRYDILSAYPYDRIKLSSDSELNTEIIDYLSQTQAMGSSSLDFPFQGGAIGYCSYDFAAWNAGLPITPQPSLEGMPLLDFGLYDWAIIADHYLKKMYLFAANNQASTKKIIPEILQLWTKPLLQKNAFTLQSDFQPLLSKKDYQDSFAIIQDYLRAGRSYQVNFTQGFIAQYEGDCWAMYKNVSTINPVPFGAFLRTDDAEIISFSPERLLLYDKGHLTTSPIKGTIGRSSNPSEDEGLKLQLQTSAKNRAENTMIVDLLRNDLGKIAKVGSVQVDKLCAINSFHSLHHLVSDISATCKDSISPFEAFITCFPGGSITGAPKIESMRIINELEPYSRGIYCGSIGYFSSHGRFDMNIAIRTMTAKNNLLHLAAGGGIVIDSDCEDEYRECYTKIAAIIHGLKG